MMSDNQWIEEARGVAARCWCDETTKHLIMEPALAEVFAQVIASWMETAAMYSGNADCWREKVEQTEEDTPYQSAAWTILPPFSNEYVAYHSAAYADRCAEHAYGAAQAATSAAKAYAEFATLTERDKAAGYAEYGKAALYARYAASAEAEYATAAAKASPTYLARRAKFAAEYAKYLARPSVQMPNEKTEAEAEADIEALIKVADAADETCPKPV